MMLKSALLHVVSVRRWSPVTFDMANTLVTTTKSESPSVLWPLQPTSIHLTQHSYTNQDPAAQKISPRLGAAAHIDLSLVLPAP